jgi:hypothetical protein
MSIVIELVTNSRAKRVLCTTADPHIKAAGKPPDPQPPATARRKATFVLPSESVPRPSSVTHVPNPPSSGGLRRRDSTVATPRPVAPWRELDVAPCVRNFPTMLRGPHRLLLSLVDPTICTCRKRHTHLARTFAESLDLPPKEVGASLKATRRACHSPAFVAELSAWVKILRTRVRSFAHLVLYVYEALLGPPADTAEAKPTRSAGNAHREREAVQKLKNLARSKRLSTLFGSSGGSTSSSTRVEQQAERAAAGQQGAEFVWTEYCVPVLRHIASLEAVEWGADSAADATRESLTGLAATDASGSATPRRFGAASTAKGPGCMLPAVTLGRWLTSWVSPWLRDSTTPLAPAEVLLAISSVREDVERRIARDVEMSASGDATGLRTAIAMLRRRQTALPAHAQAGGFRRGTTVGTTVVSAAAELQAKQAREELTMGKYDDLDSNWSPLFVRPEIIDAVKRYMSARDLSPYALRHFDGVLRNMLNHSGLLLSRAGEKDFRSRIDKDGYCSTIKLLRLLDQAAGDDYGRCSDMVRALLKERQAQRDSSASGAPPLPRITAQLVADACGYVLRPEHSEHADRAITVLESLRDDTVIEAFEAAIRRPLKPQHATGAGGIEALRQLQASDWERRALVQMRPDDPVLYVAPDTIPRRQATFDTTRIGELAKAPASPEAHESLIAAPKLSRPPKIAKYARSAEEARHWSHTQRTAEYIAASRMVDASLSALQEMAAAPNVPQAFTPRNPNAGWRRRLHEKTSDEVAANVSPRGQHDSDGEEERQGDSTEFVDAMAYHASVLLAVKPFIEQHSRREDHTTRPEAVNDLRVASPPSVDPLVFARRGVSSRSARPPSAVQQRSDALQRQKQRTGGQRELIERATFDLVEQGRGSANVVLRVDVPEMVSQAAARWASETDAIVQVAEARVRTATCKTRAIADGSAGNRSLLALVPPPFDAAAMLREVDEAMPLPRTIHHVSELDVSALIHKYVC